MSTRQIDLVFLWHMHQPDYRDPESGGFALPWTYLHVIKDYADMAAHLERHPRIRAVVNFVPVLLDQIDDYLDQFASGRFRDPLLRLLGTEDPDRIDADDRRRLLSACFRCNEATMLAPFPPYVRLREMHDLLAGKGGRSPDYLSGAYFSDLLTWYHLAWSGETERRNEPLLAELMAKGEGFSAHDRLRLRDWVGRTLAGIVPRYRALQARGQVELSATLATHPLGPLLLDFAVARDSQPQAPLPGIAAYPGGRERARRHIDLARERHAERFGTPPAGMWPAEGAVSADFVEMLAAAGCRWAASGENVLRNSLGSPASGAACHPWQLAGQPGIKMFFRDDELSDLIGFSYAKWHGRDAAADFVRRVEAVAAAAPAGETPLVSVILDGENAWETYPYNGFYFFEDLYGLLEGHPAIRTRTYAEWLDENAVSPAPTLPRLVAGSWVHGTLSTWIGDAAKNRAWELLCEAKQSYDRVMASGRLANDEACRAEALLAVCESSDWFWWFGDDNPAGAVADFDRLYRRNLAALYRGLHLEPPVALDQPIAPGRAEAAATGSGTMRRASEAPIQPT